MESSEFATGGGATVQSLPSAARESATLLIRLSGFALLVGGVLVGLGEFAWGLFVLGATDPSEYPQPIATILWVVVMLAFTGILLGLPGLYGLQARRLRAFGLIGFLVLFVGEGLMLGLANFGAFYQAPVAGLIVEAQEAGLTVEEPVMAMVGYLAAYGLHILGWILFGAAALRAGILPRWPVVLTMLGPLLLFMASAAFEGNVPSAFLVLPLMFGLGVAWLGVAAVRLGPDSLPIESGKHVDV